MLYVSFARGICTPRHIRSSRRIPKDVTVKCWSISHESLHQSLRTGSALHVSHISNVCASCTHGRNARVVEPFSCSNRNTLLRLFNFPDCFSTITRNVLVAQKAGPREASEWNCIVFSSLYDKWILYAHFQTRCARPFDAERTAWIFVTLTNWDGISATVTSNDDSWNHRFPESSAIIGLECAIFGTHSVKTGDSVHGRD